MRRSYLKLSILVIWLAAVAILFSSFLGKTNGQNKKVSDDFIENRRSKPADQIIDDFDKSIQRRFLTDPYFGIRRIQPLGPTNPHFEQFHPKNDKERASVAAFESGNWDVGIYLFGRRATPKVDNGSELEGFEIRYRLFDPLPVTKGLKTQKLRRSQKLLERVKKAFLEFQTPNSRSENEFEFDMGEWAYVARPVRAVNQSCLQCHKDYVVTEKLGDGKFKFRKRQIGDANGVLVYGFKKKD